MLWHRNDIASIQVLYFFERLEGVEVRLSFKIYCLTSSTLVEGCQI